MARSVNHGYYLFGIRFNKQVSTSNTTRSPNKPGKPGQEENQRCPWKGRHNNNVCFSTYIVLKICKRKMCGSDCGSVGGAVASNTRGPWFESSHWQNLLNICLLSTILKRQK